MTIEHHSFLIRIWRETTKSLAPFGEWHGEVQHIQSGCCWTFKSIENFLDLINASEQKITNCESLENQEDPGSLLISFHKSHNKERKNDM